MKETLAPTDPDLSEFGPATRSRVCESGLLLDQRLIDIELIVSLRLVTWTDMPFWLGGYSLKVSTNYAIPLPA
jgi:hypothetical protein